MIDGCPTPPFFSLWLLLPILWVALLLLARVGKGVTFTDVMAILTVVGSIFAGRYL